MPLDRYFKYMKSGTAKDVLTNRTLRWSTNAALNDPCDMQYDLRLDFDRTAVVSMAQEFMWQEYGKPDTESRPASIIRGTNPDLSRDQVYALVAKGLETIPELLAHHSKAFFAELRPDMAKVKVLCLSEVWDSLPMWAHYADNHRGVVLCFRDVDDHDSPYKVAKPIDYSDQPPRFLDEEAVARIAVGLRAGLGRDVINKLCLWKSPEWAVEHEWRILSGDGRDPGVPFEDVPFHPAELAEVILGRAMSKTDRDDIVAVVRARYPHAVITEATITPGELRLRKSTI